MTQKYVTAASCVSAADPAKRMTSLAKMSESEVEYIQNLDNYADIPLFLYLYELFRLKNIQMAWKQAKSMRKVQSQEI